MSGIFDRLDDQLGKSDSGGISPLDIARLPRKMRGIMRVMLREVEMEHDELAKAAKELPEKERLDDDDLEETLAELSKDGWLIIMGEGDKKSYRVNLRRKSGSTLAKSIWSALDDRIEEANPKAKTKKGSSPLDGLFGDDDSSKEAKDKTEAKAETKTEPKKKTGSPLDGLLDAMAKPKAEQDKKEEEKKDDKKK